MGVLTLLNVVTKTASVAKCCVIHTPFIFLDQSNLRSSFRHGYGALTFTFTSPYFTLDIDI